MKLAAFLRELGQPVAYYPKLAKITGSVLANLFLCQMYYWQGKQDDPDGWIYKTQPQIEAETGLTRSEQETARRLLRQRGLIAERYKGLPRRLEFWLDENELENRWAFFLEYKGEKSLVEDAKLTQKRISASTSKKPKCQTESSPYQLPETLPDSTSSIMQSSRIIACRNPAGNNAEILQANLQESCKQACSNPAGSNATILQASLLEPPEQVCGTPAFNLYTEITPEITTLPPNPPSDEQPGECASSEVSSVEVEVMKPNSPSSQSETSHSTSRQEPTNFGLGNYSATSRENENCYHQHQLQSQFPKNLDGSVSLPWDTNKARVFDPEFEKWMARSLMQYPAYRDLMAGELMTKIRKHISAGRYDMKRRDELLLIVGSDALKS